MKIRCLCILIGCVAALNISAQDISKPVIKKTEVQTPKRTTTVVNKKKAASRVVPQRNQSYNSNYSLHHPIDELVDTVNIMYEPADSMHAAITDTDSYQPMLSTEDLTYKGVTYYNNKDYSQAIELFRKAAEQGSLNSQKILGLIFYVGKVIAQDYTEASKWFHKAAEQGDKNAQQIIGEMYYEGKGVNKNYQEAIKWSRKAAEQGDKDAQFLLGRAYAGGNGVSANYYSSLYWLKKAARQEHKGAQCILKSQNETW